MEIWKLPELSLVIPVNVKHLIGMFLVVELNLMVAAIVVVAIHVIVNIVIVMGDSNLKP